MCTTEFMNEKIQKVSKINKKQSLMRRNNSHSKINKCAIYLLQILLIYNCYSYILQKANYEIYTKNGLVSFRMGVGVFFLLHVNDDCHA
jgi:hypothetical protein